MRHLGIDLGTSQVVICSAEDGILLKEPSVIAVNAKGDMVACGAKAYEMLGRNPDSITVARPVRQGAVTDFDLARKMLRYYIKRACAYRVLKPKAALCVPSMLTEVEQRSMAQTASDINLRGVTLIHKALAAAVGAGLDIASPTGCMMVHMGAGTVDAAVISLHGVAAGTSRRIGGDTMDEAIVRYMRAKYDHVIGLTTAEQIKRTVGCAERRSDDICMQVSGRNALTGLPCQQTIYGNEVLEAIEEIILQIAEVIGEVLENTPPELAGDVLAGGICLSGGLAKMEGMCHRIKRLTGVDCFVADHPEECCALGAAQTLVATRYKSRGVVTPSPFADDYEI